LRGWGRDPTTENVRVVGRFFWPEPCAGIEANAGGIVPKRLRGGCSPIPQHGKKKAADAIHEGAQPDVPRRQEA